MRKGSGEDHVGMVKTFLFILVQFHETTLFYLFECLYVSIYPVFKYLGLNKLTATLLLEVILKLKKNCNS
jgi:hypothetical protein